MSYLDAAAVHSGELAVGQYGLVNLELEGYFEVFVGSTQNGITSSQWEWGGVPGYTLTRTTPLKVQIEPADAMAAGARWRIMGQTWYVPGNTSVSWRESGDAIRIAEGEAVYVEFKSVDDSSWVAPAGIYLPGGPQEGQYTATYGVLHRLDYSAGAGGMVGVSTSQWVVTGEAAQPVVALPDFDHYFTGWSDGSTVNPQIDSNVADDLAVEAVHVVQDSRCRIAVMNFENGELK